MIPQYHYLLAFYNITDLCFGSETQLHGPFDAPDIRDEHLKSELSHIDLETSSIVNVTFLVMQDGKLEKESSFIASEEDYPFDTGSDEEDEDEDERLAAEYESQTDDPEQPGIG